MSNAAFQHLLKHFRSNKQSLVREIQTLIDNDGLIDNSNLIAIAKYSGALDCLYWQALGNELTNLAKGIRRTLAKARVHHGFEGL
ncbi:conserved hypothetical protein [Shewanella halifaxensis HAW-EB4]|uniref:Uncharacterized protein n=1 Tax=Shewanella halifaxensis (strain HAW-EB4) TaxID=458817 RepID=B0TKS9_SHEHH|nr:hypothetical protein [Shewanella halifaxensis]ABZ75881.1 conserved hypothetical protein [Shewanella halifaxensis HAW-EB4]